ncbi:hypothetical protein KM043_008274 [Ampulex compressa]|nr:hypothetical protein KM043_008274 [Ampulex compressa]
MSSVQRPWSCESIRTEASEDGSSELVRDAAVLRTGLASGLGRMASCEFASRQRAMNPEQYEFLTLAVRAESKLKKRKEESYRDTGARTYSSVWEERFQKLWKHARPLGSVDYERSATLDASFARISLPYLESNVTADRLHVALGHAGSCLQLKKQLPLKPP